MCARKREREREREREIACVSVCSCVCENIQNGCFVCMVACIKFKYCSDACIRKLKRRDALVHALVVL